MAVLSSDLMAGPVIEAGAQLMQALIASVQTPVGFTPRGGQSESNFS